jgi:hypothetical protein
MKIKQAITFEKVDEGRRDEAKRANEEDGVACRRRQAPKL